MDLLPMLLELLRVEFAAALAALHHDRLGVEVGTIFARGLYGETRDLADFFQII